MTEYADITTISIPIKIRVRDADPDDPNDRPDQLQFDVRVPDLDIDPHLGPAVVAAVIERIDQIDQGWTPTHDDAHTAREWADLIEEHLGPALLSSETASRRRAFVQVAALAIAAIEWCDRADTGDRA